MFIQYFNEAFIKLWLRTSHSFRAHSPVTDTFTGAFFEWNAGNAAVSFLPRELFEATNACFEDDVPCATGWRETSPGCDSVFCAAVAFAREVVGCSSTSFCQLCCEKESLRNKVDSRFQILRSRSKDRKLSNTKQFSSPPVARQHRLSAS